MVTLQVPIHNTAEDHADLPSVWKAPFLPPLLVQENHAIARNPIAQINSHWHSRIPVYVHESFGS